MPAAPHARRPRAAFVPTSTLIPCAAFVPCRLAFPPRRTRHHRHAPRCTLEPPPPASDRVREVRTRLESTRTRVRLLHSRAIVRAGAAGIALGETALREPAPAPADADPAAIFAQLRRDLRRLRHAADELSPSDDAVAVISQLQAVVNALERRVAEQREAPAQPVATSQPGSFVGDEIEEGLEGPVGLVEDMQWPSQPADGSEQRVAARVEPAEFVDAVRRKVSEKGHALKRRASSLGAGIEEKVAEYVKDDGSIDVEGLRALVRGILDNASMTWKRLNGLVPQSRDATAEGEASEVAYSSLSVRDPEKEFRLREEIGDLEKKLIESSREREAVLRREDQLGKLIRAKEIRLMDDGVSVLRRTLAVRVLQLEMEKIFVSVADEIENSDYQMMMEQRVLVVEFGDLDERLATLELFIDQDEPLLIDDDVLGELAVDIQDLKTRLGLDEALYSAAMLSWPQLRQFFASSAKKSREGAEFYWRGLRLFAGDLRFAMRLIRRAIVGYTPSPREIRTIRRTGRDLLTLVPFTIVLILPLTPVGHVLIFSFLQRYWPEFFPSTFSERRQAVMKRHEQYAKSLWETNGEQNGIDGAEGDGDSGRGGGPRRGGGMLSGLRKLVLFGVLAREPADVGEDEGAGLSGGKGADGAGRAETGGDEEGMVDQSGAGAGKNGEVRDGEGNGIESEKHPVALSDLAESAQDSEKIARKKRIGLALDELHLAD